MLEFLKAIIFGLVEGITEWLPISSTGHLIILDRFMAFKGTSQTFFELFDVLIQLGAILAVVVLYFKQIWPFAFTKKFKEETGSSSVFVKDKWLLWAKILVASVPAGIIGVLFDDFFNEHFYNSVCVAVALIVFGILFIIVENSCKGRSFKVNTVADITFALAFQIGFFQLLAAVFPGTSRSGATILGALILGVARPVAAEFTFFLAIPAMAGASLLKLIKLGLDVSGTEWALLFTGMAVSFVVSLFALKFLISFIKKHDFKPFGIYRIVLGVVVLALEIIL